MFSTFAAALIAACSAGQGASPGAGPPDLAACLPAGTRWRAVATEDDRRRMRRWRDAWGEALEQARAAGHSEAIAGEGALLEPDAALVGPAIPPGDYDCRTIKLGTPSSELDPFVAYPRFRCRIAGEGDRVTFAKLDGSQRPIGRLFPDFDRRLVFLGTLQLGDERRSHEYGADRERDMAGSLERIGDRRWRLVFPYPRFESLVDVIELVPAGAAN
ncbi:DUF4893 domain-containing protein [Sphingosinicella terrae]|uniref:DUF4893 domain-containing protein n=1 Tax=Sphingosinicella terrae TaxID=2172047 RepID=UPI000E0D57CE|nr:DUF4893 domain-containing protein [Sphingosinicella terrae]